MAAAKTILITGPESSGKSTLSEQLSETLKGNLVKEYARKYLSKLNTPYLESDLQNIITEQYQLELKARELKSQDYLIFDTGPLVLSIWLEVKFGKKSALLQDWVHSLKYDLVFLCKPDIPWQPDPLREHPNERMNLYNLYIKKLNQLNINYIIVEGNKKERLEFSLQKINLLNQ